MSLSHAVAPFPLALLVEWQDRQPGTVLMDCFQKVNVEVIWLMQLAFCKTYILRRQVDRNSLSLSFPLSPYPFPSVISHTAALAQRYQLKLNQRDKQITSVTSGLHGLDRNSMKAAMFVWWSSNHTSVMAAPIRHLDNRLALPLLKFKGYTRTGL